MINISRISEQDNQKMMDWVANIRNPETKNKILFITGERGSGKTELSRQIADYVIVATDKGFAQRTGVCHLPSRLEVLENHVVIFDNVEDFKPRDWDLIGSAYQGILGIKNIYGAERRIDFSETVFIINGCDFKIPADIIPRSVCIQTINPSQD